MTLDSIQNLTAIRQSLRKLARRPTARIVFDEGMGANYYAQAVADLHADADIMGELLDSFYMKSISVADYAARASEYLRALGDHVDLWEVGNEINGEWLGTSEDVAAKLAAAYDLVKAQGKRAAMTLYYNEGCWAKADHEMFAWAAANVPARMKAGLDYVWISYYEEDCNERRPDWPTVFSRLGQMFPNSRIGFGETGDRDAADKAAVLDRYYGMDIAHPRYVGGQFWWYYIGDMVPETKPLWSALNAQFSRR